MQSHSALYLGAVTHRRVRPFRHRFDYRVFSLLLDLDELPGLAARLRTLSHNRFNILSVHDGDHGRRDGTPLRSWVTDALAGAGIDDDGGPVRLLAMPRLFGYVFNPLSLFYCYDRSGALTAIVYEVSNTFGQSHSYVCRVDPGPESAPIRQNQDKRFYVSPFIGMRATYRFRLTQPGERVSVLIRQDVPEGLQLVATLNAERRPLTDRALLAALARDPVMTFKVIGAIHWQAFKLWRKGARFHSRPKQPAVPFGH